MKMDRIGTYSDQNTQIMYTYKPLNIFSIGGVLMITLLLLASPLNSYSQTGDPDTIPHLFHFKLLVEAAIYECDITGKQLSPTPHAAPAEAIFSKIGTSGNFVIIRFWKWKDKNAVEQEKFNYADSSKNVRKYFLLSIADFNAKAIPRYRTSPSFTMGTVIVPVKIRTSPFDFSTDVTLGPVAGARFRLSPYTNTNFFNVVTGFGVTHITLDSLNTKGNIMQTSDRPAITLSFGGVLEFSNAQIGLFVGWDYISQNEQIKWEYQGKPWLSIGLGYTILTHNSNQPPGREGNN